ncbi:MAG: D-aminoacyl-tRNA deacylase [Candidatus Aminicenantia bacterium]
MKIVIQRVKESYVKVNDRIVGKIGKGLLLLIGIERGDEENLLEPLAYKILNLRIFPDENKKMNLSLLNVGGDILAISQFTLAGSIEKGRRPSFDNAEEPKRAEYIFNRFVEILRNKGVNVEKGEFGSMMEVYLINDGPVTFIISTPRAFK